MHSLLLAGDSAAHNPRSDTKALKMPWELRWMGEGSAVPLVIQALPPCCRSKEQSDEMLVEALMRIQVDLQQRAEPRRIKESSVLPGYWVVCWFGFM